MSFLSELNDRQREAAETLQGPLLIVAGAGSGKTRALTYRIANIIAQGKAQPWQILAVTFTNKAASEMKARVARLLEEKFEGLNPKNTPMIGTFHSICVRILRKHMERLGRENNFVIYDTTDTQGIMKRLIKEKGIEDEKIKYQVVLGMISKCKNQLHDGAHFAARASTPFERTVAELFLDYEKRLRDNNAVDFDDLIALTVRVFREHPDVLDECQERWRYINVDEYQDTNHAQYALTKLLADKYRNLCVIGDSDQSIYSFRGADISNILDFEKDYAEAKVVKLEQNYRSTQVILDAADAVIEKNKNRKPKKMWTEKEGGDLIEVVHVRGEQEEAREVAREALKLRRDGASLNDMVVLYRTNAQSRNVEEAFLREGIPYKVIGGVKFYARKEIKDILAYLRVILSASDTESLLRIVNTPPRRIGQSTIQKMQAFALGRSLTLAEVLKHVEMVDELSAGAKSSLSGFWSMMEGWRREAGGGKNVSELIRMVMRDIDYKGYLLDGTEEGEMRWENVQELESVATKYDGLDDGLASFLEEVALVADTDSIPEDEDVISLMTLHSVKGLEYPYVFIVGCEESIFPHSRALLDGHELEEERRLMYVGVTRAMKKLYLLAAAQRMIFGDYQSNPPSRFLDDIPEDLVEKRGLPSRGAELGRSASGALSASGFGATPANLKFKVPNFFDQRSEEEQRDAGLRDGDKVRHKSFGEGMIIEQRGDLVTVAFTNKAFGIKKFAANIAPLERI